MTGPVTVADELTVMTGDAISNKPSYAFTHHLLFDWNLFDNVDAFVDSGVPLPRGSRYCCLSDGSRSANGLVLIIIILFVNLVC